MASCGQQVLYQVELSSLSWCHRWKAHVRIKKPAKSGSMYYNYKGYFSLILLAIVDADYTDYKFIWCNTGVPGSASDAGVFNGSRLRTSIEEGRITFPDPEPLPSDDNDMPYFFIGDDAFALRKWMMKPYSDRHLSHSQTVFNYTYSFQLYFQLYYLYRLSRARRVVENAFGILANRWRCILTCIELQPRNVIHVVEAAFILHNLLRMRQPRLSGNEVDCEDGQGNLIPGAWRQNMQLTDTEAATTGRPNYEGKVQRNYLMDYYNSDIGRVPWQDDIVNR